MRIVEGQSKLVLLQNMLQSNIVDHFADSTNTIVFYEVVSVYVLTSSLQIMLYCKLPELCKRHHPFRLEVFKV